MDGLPSAVLFACNMNSIRSPMAESILKFLQGHQIYVDSVGVRGGEIDGFAIAAMDEIGIDLTRHRHKTFDDLEDFATQAEQILSQEGPVFVCVKAVPNIRGAKERAASQGAPARRTPEAIIDLMREFGTGK